MESKQGNSPSGKSEPLEEIRKELEECKRQRDEYLESWKRAAADLINYKKEEQERIAEWQDYTKEEFVRKLLPVLDNLHKAESSLSEEVREDNNIKGLLNIVRQIEKILELEGFQRIKALGEKFDPRFHEVVEVVEISGEESEKIVEEIQPGYIFKNKVIRAAKVKVAK